MPANLGKEMKGYSSTRADSSSGADPDLEAKLRAQAEADYRQRLIKATLQQLKESMEREKRLAAVARSKVEASWLRILRLAKLDELRRDVEVLAQQHEREVDRRDALLQMLERDLEESEEQHRGAIRAHLRSIDGLLSLQSERLGDLESAFLRELGELERSFGAERAALDRAFDEEVRELRARIVAADEREEERAAAARQAHEQTREALRNAAAERVESLARGCDERIRQLERAFEREHRAYLRRTDTVAEKFKELTARDQRTQRELRDRAKRLRTLRAQVLATRGKLLAVGRDYEAKNERLTRERTAVAAHVAALKDRLARARSGARDKVASLGAAAGAAKSSIAQAASLAERVLALSERCRALETEHERIDPARDGAEEDIRAKRTAQGEERGGGGGGVEGVEEAHASTHSTLDTTALPLSLVASGHDPLHAAGERGWRRKVDAGPAKEAPLLRKEAKEGREGKEAEEKVERGEDGGEEGGKGVVLGGDSSAAHTLAEILEGGELEALDRFHRRVNHATLEKLALEQEKSELETDHARLKEALAQTLEGMSMTPDTLARPNPLLVVNGRTGAVRGPAARIGGLPVRLGPPRAGVAALGAAAAVDGLKVAREHVARARPRP